VSRDHGAWGHDVAQGAEDMADQKRTLDIPSYEAGSPARLTADTTEVGTDDDGQKEVAARDSAGMTEISLAESADEYLRRPDADRAAVLDAEENLNPNSSLARVRRARVNQHYNEVETGGITGIGSDDAAPLQDVDFELG
jgi:hypothetical protein